MSLTSSLNIATSGLSANTALLNLISQNVSNASSSSYVKKTLTTIQNASGGVQTGTVTRALDQLLQKQLWSANSSAGYTSTASSYIQQLDQLFGSTDDSSSLSTLYNNFTSSLQTLASDPSSTTNRAQVLQYAQQLAGSLNDLSDGVQTLRSNTESQISDDVTAANTALAGLESVSKQLSASTGGDNTALLDQRDAYIDQLSQLMDIKVTQQSNGSVSVATTSGTTLFDGSTAVRLKFDAQSNLSAQASGGTLSIVNPNGTTVDAGKIFRSGEFKSLLDLRDTTLPQAQTQLDVLAANLSQALSDSSPASTAVTSGSQSGYSIDLTGIQDGNAASFSYTQGGVTKNVRIVDVDNPASLPLSSSTSTDPNDIVIGVSFSGGVGSAISSIQSALTAKGINVSVSNPSGNTLQVLDDGTGTAKVNSLGANITSTSLTGTTELPLFVDGSGNTAYTGSFENGSQLTGFASRIKVNPGVVADTSKLVASSSSTASGDATRPNLMLDRLTDTTRQFSYQAGLSGTGAPYTGTVGDFLNGIIAAQGAASTAAQSLDAGQQVTVSTLQAKASDTSSVSVDEELSNLIQVQNAYSANAKIISVVQELFQVLQNM